MALHRKLRGSDELPQFVRLPAARAPYSAVPTATRSLPSSSSRQSRKSLRLDRDREPRTAAQISSVQLRACFLLCVALYFGTIYFADSIVGLGQALGSEPVRRHDFFVQAPGAIGAIRLRVGDGADEGFGGEEETDGGLHEGLGGEDNAEEGEEQVEEAHEMQGAAAVEEQRDVEEQGDLGDAEKVEDAGPPGEAHVAVPIAEELEIKEKALVEAVDASPAAAADAPELASPAGDEGTFPVAAPTQRAEEKAPVVLEVDQKPVEAVQAVEQVVQPEVVQQEQVEDAAKPTALVNRPEERDEHR